MDIETFVVPPKETNVYLLYDADAKEAVLVDSALGAATVLPRIAQLGVALKTLVNTHGHAAHIAENVAIAKATGAKVGIHEADAWRLDRVAHEANPYLPSPPPASKPDLVLKEGSVVKVGAAELRVVHTPGHTEGSVSLYATEAGCLFSGDTLFAGSFGDPNGAGGSPAMMFRSLRRIASLPPETKVFPGHGPPTRVGDESWIPNLAYAAPH